MDFYKELLTRFSKQHNRTLKLLEADVAAPAGSDPRIKDAVGILKGTQWQPMGQQGSTQVARINNKEVRYYGSGKVVSGFGNAQWDGNQNLTSAGDDKKFKQLLTVLVGPLEEDGSYTGAGGGDQQVQPIDGEDVAEGVTDATAKADILSTFANIRINAKEAWKKLFGKATNKD